MIILKDSNIQVCSPESIASVLQKWLVEQDEIEQNKEHGIVIVLNTRKRVILVDVVSVGFLDIAPFNPREVFRRAIGQGGATIILAHNHPSCDCSPSDDDIACTKRMSEAGRVIGIHVVDHIIFSQDEYYSFCEKGLL